MMKTACLIFISTFFFMTSSAQNTKQTIEKLSKDPATAANAAKADVYIVNNKKVICDTPMVAKNRKVSQRKKINKKR